MKTNPSLICLAEFRTFTKAKRLVVKVVMGKRSPWAGDSRHLGFETQMHRLLKFELSTAESHFPLSCVTRGRFLVLPRIEEPSHDGPVVIKVAVDVIQKEVD